jgi:hypothetical protein
MVVHPFVQDPVFFRGVCSPSCLGRSAQRARCARGSLGRARSMFRWVLDLAFRNGLVDEGIGDTCGWAVMRCVVCDEIVGLLLQGDDLAAVASDQVEVARAGNDALGDPELFPCEQLPVEICAGGDVVVHDGGGHGAEMWWGGRGERGRGERGRAVDATRSEDLQRALTRRLGRRCLDGWLQPPPHANNARSLKQATTNGMSSWQAESRRATQPLQQTVPRL